MVEGLVAFKAEGLSRRETGTMETVVREVHKPLLCFWLLSCQAHHRACFWKVRAVRRCSAGRALTRGAQLIAGVCRANGREMIRPRRRPGGAAQQCTRESGTSQLCPRVRACVMW